VKLMHCFNGYAMMNGSSWVHPQIHHHHHHGPQDDSLDKFISATKLGFLFESIFSAGFILAILYWSLKIHYDTLEYFLVYFKTS